jgi:hypothetical protein
MDSEIENIKDRISNFLMRESLDDLPKFIDTRKDAAKNKVAYNLDVDEDLFHKTVKETIDKTSAAIDDDPLSTNYFRNIIENLEREQKLKSSKSTLNGFKTTFLPEIK